MILTDLPLELFQCILSETVFLAGVRNALYLRLVSKVFDKQIQRAIYLLPSFENRDYASQPSQLLCPYQMHPAMKFRLIMLKHDIGNVQTRPLFQAIDRALTYLESHTTFVKGETRSQRHLVEALATAAARNLRMYALAVCLLRDPGTYLASLEARRAEDAYAWSRLHKGRDWPRSALEYIAQESHMYVDTAAQDALIAAFGAERVDLAEELLKNGVCATTRSRAFGVPLQVAATMGLEGIVERILGDVSRDGEITLLYAKRTVLKGAVEGGRKDWVRMLLEELESDEEWERHGMSRLIHKAIRDRNEGIALMLLRKRTPLSSGGGPMSPPLVLERRELKFFGDVSEKAEQYGCEEVFRVAQEAMSVAQEVLRVAWEAE